jgi:hypothetical protein
MLKQCFSPVKCGEIMAERGKNCTNMQKVEKVFVSKTPNACFSLFSVLKLAEHNKSVPFPLTVQRQRSAGPIECQRNNSI